jgi:hypothetical protein
MSDVPGAPATPEIQPGVMSSLPKTRPQRPSARRASARRAAAAQGSGAAEDASPVRPGQPRNARKTPTRKAPTPQAPTREAPSARKKPPAVKLEPPRAPRQGFEVESEIETGKTVTPPNSVELAASVVELLGELAQSGIRSGERLLRDALTRRPSS